MKKILVVDNDRIVLRFMTKLLEKEGHQVVTAEDGINALDILKNYMPDVIFVDLVMPNIDGDRLCRIIRRRQELKDTYVVILSAIAAEKKIDIDQLGANACIAKGPLNIMVQNVLAILDQLPLESSQSLSKEVFGINDIYPRGITRELLSVKRHFEIILERMSEGILEINSEGRIVFANRFALLLIGIPDDTLLGSRFVDVFSGDVRQRVCDLMEIQGDGSKTITENSPVPLNEHLVTLNILPLDGDGFASIIIIDDVSERKRIESQIQHAQKMESIGTLAGGIAHDFNNLLMGIQGRTSLMLMDIDSSHPHFEHLTGIEDYVENTAKLTRQLLGIARGGKYEVKSTNLNEFIKHQNSMFVRTRPEINIREQYKEDLWTTDVDQGQIEQVLLNLYINAWQSMPGGGELFIQTDNVFIDESYTDLYQVKPGKYVKISIADNGVGMDEETQYRIFDPFFTTKKMSRGTGLGLASAYGIIKNHGGFINVFSKKGDGATFSIYLPASEKEIKGNNALPEGILKGFETILLVDDEDIIMDVGQEMLKMLGYVVLPARSGKEAIEAYIKNKDKIDLVILDMIMPDMAGGETYDKLKEVNPNIKVLLSSGYSINSQASEILESGCNGFIQKPFNMKALSIKIREILDAAEPK